MEVVNAQESVTLLTNAVADAVERLGTGHPFGTGAQRKQPARHGCGGELHCHLRRGQSSADDCGLHCDTAGPAGTTDANGQAQATLSTPGDNTNRNITVTASVGSTSSTIVIGVVGTKLSLTGPANLIQGSAGTYTIVLADSGGTGIAGQAVMLSFREGNTLSRQLQ